MHPSLFIDPQRQAEFDQNGFVILPFLNTEEVEQMMAYYQSLPPDVRKERGFRVTLDHPSHQEVESVMNTIIERLNPPAQAHFQQFKLFTGSFVVKATGPDTIVPPHQDWTFTDETQFDSVTVWIPLVDVDERNGALAVIPGSHRLFDRLRPSPSPQSPSPLSAHYSWLTRYMHMQPMKAGQALVFHNALIHASPPNQTAHSRIGMGIGIIKAEAPLRHYYHLPDEDKLLELAVTPKFFTIYNNSRLSQLYDMGDRPVDGRVLGTQPHTSGHLEQAMLEEKIQELTSLGDWPGLTEEPAPSLPTDPPVNTEPEQQPEPAIEQEAEPVVEQEQPIEEPWRDPRSFFEKYTLSNILAEIIWRLKGRP